MSTDPQAPHSPKMQEYLQAWGTSVGRVLQEVAGAPHTWQELSPEATRQLLASLIDNSISIQFEASQNLAGNQGFVLAKKDAVRLSQLLLAEPEDGSAVMSEDHRDAIAELFRQFAGAAASSAKGLAGGEVSFKWLGLNPFPGEPAERAGMQWSSPGLTTVALIAELDSGLVKTLNPVATPVVRALELPHTHAGSVVELNQYVQDPVELWVGKKVIARGEVVVVDGSYGLRVLEIVSPMERIASLQG